MDDGDSFKNVRPGDILTYELEVENLYSIIRELKSKNITVIYISHKMDEIFDLSDKVTVLRDGKAIDTMNISETSREDIVNKMVGRDMDHAFPHRTPENGEPVLKVENIYIDGKLDNINFELKKGEAPNETLLQILRYMSWVRQNLSDGKDVKGIILTGRLKDHILK